jgi:predicted  nucleic acid-binding Zn-ribbon protein
MTKKVNSKSLANLNPRNRYQGKERFNTTLLPETICWLQQSGNASQKIEELVLEAKSGNAHELINSDNTYEQKQADVSDSTHELRLVTDSLYQVEEKLSAVANVVERWELQMEEATVKSKTGQLPRTYDKASSLLKELRALGVFEKT